ncbi:MAG: transketolase C-terminal domain-containing protein [Candidatus Coatesbacteria bacterium]
MRSAFIAALSAQAATDARIFLLTGDLGWTVVEEFAGKYPGRFLNAGVAEQNMAGLATGLAQAGFVPFTYTIATFASMRAYEQIRNGPVLHRLPVRIVGVGGGFAYGHAGMTHFALEDLAIARAQPGLTVIVPADPAQTKSVMDAIRAVEGPVYLRVGKGGNPEVPGLNGRFALGRPEVVVEGSEVLLLATGGIAVNAVEASRRLRADEVSAAVAVMAHLPHAPTPELRALLGRFKAVVTVEEGYTAGGLGSLAAEAIAQAGLGCRLLIRGVHASPRERAGSTAFLQAAERLSPAALADSARTVLSAVPK